MPRAKAQPKRARSPSPPPPTLAAMVESAEIEAVRQRLASGAVAAITPESPGPSGLVCGFDLPPADFEVLCALHETIKTRASRLTGWGGAADDSGRLRGYGYFVGNELSERHHAADTTMRESTGEAATADAAANRRASVLLARDECPDGLDATLERLCATLRSALLRATGVEAGADELVAPGSDAAPAAAVAARAAARQLTPDSLVAAQLNLHEGKPYLRPPLDEPLNDGFGVVIATVAVRGSGRILLASRPWDAEARCESWFRLARGQCYALSGDARNVCTHGVLSDEGCERRESLNLRFGLHRSALAPDGPCADEEVERHWPA